MITESDCHDSGMNNNLLAKQITKQPLSERKSYSIGCSVCECGATFALNVTPCSQKSLADRLSFLGTAPHSAHVARVRLFQVELTSY